MLVYKIRELCIGDGKGPVCGGVRMVMVYCLKGLKGAWSTSVKLGWWFGFITNRHKKIGWWS
jgi:hypothetical protein